MIRKGLLLSAVVLGLLATRPAPAAAQLGITVSCTPGIPSCTSLRFFLSAVGTEQAINNIFLQFVSPGWTWMTGGSPGVGSYSAQDSFGPFGGFTTIGNGGTSLAIDFFNDNGFPFDVLAGDTGFFDLGVNGTGSIQGLVLSYNGQTATGAPFSGNIAPEPTSLLLLGTGLAGLVAARRKKRKVVET